MGGIYGCALNLKGLFAVEREKLYNPQYSKLPKEEREAFLRSVPQLDSRFIFVKFERFERFALETDSAIYAYEGKEFVFVPGARVTLGWDGFVLGKDEPAKEEILKSFIEEYYEDEDDEEEPIMTAAEVEILLHESMSPVRRVTISPMLVERTVNGIGWRTVDSSEAAALAETYQEYITRYMNGFEIHNEVKFSRNDDQSMTVQVYSPISLADFLALQHKDHFSLPTEDEWEYLCGGGSRTLFRWGNQFDYTMRLRYFKYLVEDNLPEDAPYTLQEPNQFGLLIAHNPYKMEVVENSEHFLKGGDGGGYICGGTGMVLGYLPTATYFRNYTTLTDDPLGYQEDIGGNYTSYRRIVRL